MKSRLISAALALFLALFPVILGVFLLLPLTACSEEEQHRDAIGDILGLSLSKGTEVLYEDTHGGFHGDGYTRAVYSLEEDLAGTIAKDRGWKPLPATDGLTRLLEGTEGGPFRTEEGEPFFPGTEQGYYYFRDRHAEAGDDREEGQWSTRPSRNLTLALYDPAACRLYYVAFDT